MRRRVAGEPMAVLPMRWERATPVPPAKARAWWFDLQEDDHAVAEYQALKRGNKGAAPRRIVERGPAHVKAMDTYSGWTFPAVVRLQGEDALAYELGEGKYVHRATLRFLPDGAGTRMVWDGEVRVGGLWSLGAALFKGNLQREFREDQELHTRHMERAWREAPW